MTKELDRLLEKFPLHRAKILELYGSNSNFRSLCEDFWISAQALNKHRASLKSALVLTEEYDTICSLLEKEVMNYLQENNHNL